MNYSSEQLINEFDSLISHTVGKPCQFAHVTGYENAQTDSLVFIQNIEHIAFFKQQKPAIIVTTEPIAQQLTTQYDGLIVCVENVRLAQALIKQRFDDYRVVDEEWDAIHASALIHPSATLGNNVRIGPNTVIGANCHIGHNTIIRSNTVIEYGVVIGNDCVIHNGVNVGYNCQLGDRVILRSGCIIGSEGFGFAQGDDKQYHRIPHTGRVILGNDVCVGANCSIDRGTYGDTKLQHGVKLDSLCHIAHNVEIGENTVLAAQTGIAGSAKIGNRVIASGQTGIIDHQTVADDSVLVHRCGVTDHIPKAGMWAGTPAKPFREYVQNLSLNKKVKKLEHKINDLMKQLNMQNKCDD